MIVSAEVISNTTELDVATTNLNENITLLFNISEVSTDNVTKWYACIIMYSIMILQKCQDVISGTPVQSTICFTTFYKFL